LKKNKSNTFIILAVLGLGLPWTASACHSVPLSSAAVITPLSEPAGTDFAVSAADLPATAMSAATEEATQVPVALAAAPAKFKPAGTLLAQDTFSGSALWNSVSGNSGDIIVSGEKITLAVKKEKGMLAVMRSETLPDDYYLEMTAEVRMCRGEDVIGVLFRAPNDQAGYRLMIGCDGRIALQQVIGGSPHPIVDWMNSHTLQPGLPFPIKIGILASGKTIRIFLNQVQQIEVNTDLFREGGLAVYARSIGDTPLTVNFSEIKIYQPEVILENEAGISSTADPLLR
jgi:hypothetical protein